MSCNLAGWGCCSWVPFGSGDLVSLVKNNTSLHSGALSCLSRSVALDWAVAGASSQNPVTVPRLVHISTIRGHQHPGCPGGGGSYSVSQGWKIVRWTFSVATVWCQRGGLIYSLYFASDAAHPMWIFWHPFSIQNWTGLSPGQETHKQLW